MAFYERAQEEMQPLMAAALESPRDLRRRIEAVIEVKLRYFARDRALLRALTSHIDPADPLSPFSLETKAIRARDIEMFGKAIGGARQKTHPDLAGHMPGLLWLYQMGLILYWTFDGSRGQHRTRILFEKSLSVVVTLMRFSGFPPLKPARRLIRELLEAASFDASSPDG
jgi:AcrR family transcriptional regulator